MYRCRYDSIVARKIKQFAVSEEGVGLIEFILSMPILIVLLYGVIELSHFELLNKKIDQVSNTTANIVTQQSCGSNCNTSLTAILNDIMNYVVAQIMQPYPFSANGEVIITDVVLNASSMPQENWQYCGGGTFAASSRVAPGGHVTLNSMPAGYSTSLPNEVIVVEVFYKFTPLFSGDIIPSYTLYKVALYPPRNGLQAFTSPVCG